MCDKKSSNSLEDLTRSPRLDLFSHYGKVRCLEDIFKVNTKYQASSNNNGNRKEKKKHFPGSLFIKFSGVTNY